MDGGTRPAQAANGLNAALLQAFVRLLVGQSHPNVVDGSQPRARPCERAAEHYVHRNEAQLRRGMAMLDGEFELGGQKTLETDVNERRFGT